jgi:hypothetical protein
MSEGTHKAMVGKLLAKPPRKGSVCCCYYGAAVSGEWPEFECIDCPVHQNAFGMADRKCRRHLTGSRK